MNQPRPGRCDRCGSPIESGDTGSAQQGRTVIQRYADRRTHSHRARLCEACWRSLEEWLKGKLPGRDGDGRIDGASIVKGG